MALTHASTAAGEGAATVPEDADAERLLLGGLMMQPRYLDNPRLVPGLFWTADHRRCFEALRAIWQRERDTRRVIPFGKLEAELQARGVRRWASVAFLPDPDGFGSDALARVAELEDYAERRRRIDVAYRLLDEAYSSAPLRPWKDSAVSRAQSGAKGVTFDV